MTSATQHQGAMLCLLILLLSSQVQALSYDSIVGQKIWDQVGQTTLTPENFVQ